MEPPEQRNTQSIAEQLVASAYMYSISNVNTYRTVGDNIMLGVRMVYLAVDMCLTYRFMYAVHSTHGKETISTQMQQISKLFMT
eukprot:scaffold48865_cov21-Prasinocladus_malaysianus.AAC.2